MQVGGSLAYWQMTLPAPNVFCQIDKKPKKEILDISIFPQISRDDKTDTGGRNGPVNGNGSIVFPA